MKKILIFGNSGSGKSTLAKRLQTHEGLSHLDLDTLAWQPGQPPERRALHESKQNIDAFINGHKSWVIEGGYSDLLQIALPFSNEIIFMNLSIEACIVNAKKRPWEPHKYESKQAQDANLNMLVEWIAQYHDRNDVFSFVAHKNLYDGFSGKKSMCTSNKSHL